MGQPNDTSLPGNSSVMDAERIDVQRTEQSWRFACIACVIWVFMSGLFWLRGYEFSAGICTVQTFVMLILLYVFRLNKGLESRRRFTHLFLGFSCLAVFFVAVSDPRISVAMFYLPLSIVMSAQILGVQHSTPWLGVNLLAFLAYPQLSQYFDAASSINEFDNLVLAMGLAIGTFLSCCQSEILFRQRNKKLVELSSGYHRLATTDSLTGLMNRHKFQQQLEEALQDAEQKSGRVALLSIDMDGFKDINDTLGHLVGDDTLREIAKRLTSVAEFETAYRLGGDEFCVIMSGLERLQSANDLAKSIHQALCERYFLANTEFPLGASIGIALYPDHASSARDLVAFADTAMYHAKKNVLGICGYDDEMTEQLVAKAKMQNRLSSALSGDEFFLVYQPQIELETGTVLGVEALLRWKCDGKVVSPVEFVPLLEKSRLIIPVGRWLVHEACRQLREWNDAGYDIRISVNVSVVQFHDIGFTRSVCDAIDAHGVDPGRLEFEVTEGVLIENFSKVIQRLTQLKEKGVTISIDDFGTGFSSLSYLRQLPLDKLKIDRTFVKDIPKRDNGTIAHGIVVLAKSLGLTIIAEGVETKEQLDFLKRNHCDQYQGFFHSRPAEASEVTKYFNQDQSLSLLKPKRVVAM